MDGEMVVFIQIGVFVHDISIWDDGICGSFNVSCLPSIWVAYVMMKGCNIF